MVQYIYQTPLKPLYLVASADALTMAYWDLVDSIPLVTSLEDGEGMEVLRTTVSQLDEYFAGARRNFDIPMQAEGTDFQRNVWGKLMDIPYGRVCSYSDIARELGDMNAIRAVGTANGANPISIIVPCHRVVGADGKLRGYAGGVDMKQWLLNHELQFSVFE